MSLVSDHLSARRRRIRGGYGLVLLENLLELLWPVAIGLAVDGLIRNTWGGVAVFVVLSLSLTAVGFVGQRYASRTFNGLYADVTADLVEQQRRAGVDTAAVSGRAELAGEYVEFYEQDVPLAITAAFTVVGSLVMLFVYDPVVGAAAAVIALPVMLINRRLMARSEGLYRELNDLAEVEVDVIGRGRRAESRRHFGIVSRRWVRLSDAEATSWSLVEVVAIGLWVLALARATSGTIDVGVIIAMIAYVWSYTAGFEAVPGVLQRLTRLRDIRRRLDDEAVSAADGPAAP